MPCSMQGFFVSILSPLSPYVIIKDRHDPLFHIKGSMKFIADAMLGRLAKWMRFLGCDVAYDAATDDRQLVRIARQEERTVLTRDTGLLRRKGLVNPVFIVHDDVFAQLDQIKGLLGPCLRDAAARCLECNGVLTRISDREEIRENVPDYVYRSVTRVLRCGACSKVYWEGTHYRKMKDKIRGIFGEIIED